MKLGYGHTVTTCFLGYICQSVTINFAPLLFLTFSSEFDIPLSSITALITVNFAIQLLTDLVSPRFVDKIGYKTSMLIAHALCAVGMILLPTLPSLLGGFFGLLTATMFYAVGGGLLEVLASPIIDSCPVKNKSGLMSLLHSFYCWGIVITVLISTAFFAVFDIENWRIMSLLWAILPIANAIYITAVPMPEPPPVELGKTDLKTVFSTKIFWIFLAMMFASGASEMAIQQWASTFAESALKVDKSLGDLIGVCGYALMMGGVRLLHGKFSERLPKKLTLFLCAVMTLGCFMAVALAKNPIVGFLGCIFCGFAVGIFWPGTFNLATSKMPGCTTSMFALLSLAGDVGCTTGPTVTGFVSDAFGGDLRMGILVASIFPVLMILSLSLLTLVGRQRKNG